MAQLNREIDGLWRKVGEVDPVPGDYTNYWGQLPVASIDTLAADAGLAAAVINGRNWCGIGSPYTLDAGDAYGLVFRDATASYSVDLNWYTLAIWGGDRHSLLIASPAEGDKVDVTALLTEALGEEPSLLEAVFQVAPPLPAFWTNFTNTAEIV